MTTPQWLAAVKKCERRDADLVRQRTVAANERARIITAEVERRGRGGRQSVADDLGKKVLVVDEAIKRARTAPPATGLPHDLLDRLYALELTDLQPLPERLWQAVAQVLAGTFVDASWIEQPGHILSGEIEDAAGDTVDEDDAKRLAEAARSWTRVQALAVIDAIRRQDFDALPTDSSHDVGPES